MGDGVGNAGCGAVGADGWTVGRVRLALLSADWWSSAFAESVLACVGSSVGLALLRGVASLVRAPHAALLYSIPLIERDDLPSGHAPGTT